jgi:hypothetical protein
MRLGSKDCLKKPSSVVYLPDMPNLFQTGDSFTHERNLLCAVLDFLDRNSGAVPRVNYAFVISHRNKHATIVEHGPIFPNHCIDGILEPAIEVGEVQAFTKNCPVKSLVKLKGERGSATSSGGGGCLSLRRTGPPSTLCSSVSYASLMSGKPLSSTNTFFIRRRHFDLLTRIGE